MLKKYSFFAYNTAVFLGWWLLFLNRTIDIDASFKGFMGASILVFPLYIYLYFVFKRFFVEETLDYIGYYFIIDVAFLFLTPVYLFLIIILAFSIEPLGSLSN